MGAAFSQSACARLIMIALHKHHAVIFQGAIGAFHCIFQCSNAFCRLVITITIVAAEQEAVSTCITGILHLGQNAGYHLRSGSISGLILEIGAGNDRNASISEQFLRGCLGHRHQVLFACGLVHCFCGLVPFFRGLVPYIRGLVPFFRGLVPFFRGLVPFFRGLVPFIRGLVPFIRGLVPFI